MLKLITPTPPFLNPLPPTHYPASRRAPSLITPPPLSSPDLTPQPQLEFEITAAVRLGSLLRCLDRECCLLRHDDSTELFMTGLTLLHHCAQTRSNCLVLIAKQAPGVLLRCLIHLLKW